MRLRAEGRKKEMGNDTERDAKKLSQGNGVKIRVRKDEEERKEDMGNSEGSGSCRDGKRKGMKRRI